jgi:hypothetical protein
MGNRMQDSCLDRGEMRLASDSDKKIGAKRLRGRHTHLSMGFDIHGASRPHRLPLQIMPWTQPSPVLPG